MDSSDLNGFASLFLATLGIPYLIAVATCIGLSFKGSSNRRVAIRNASVYVLWCTAAGFLVNFVFVITPVRIALFVLLALGGVAIARLFDRER